MTSTQSHHLPSNFATKWLYNLEPIDVKNKVEVERNQEVIEIVDDDDKDDVGAEESGRKKIAKDYQMYVHTHLRVLTTISDCFSVPLMP